jgi:hypothetical protein
MSILLLAKLAKPFMGTARIVINSLHIKGDVCKVAFFFLCSLSSFSGFFLKKYFYCYSFTGLHFTASLDASSGWEGYFVFICVNS